MAPRKRPIGSEAEGVLASFAAEHPRPRAQDVRDWSKRHPDLADEILELGIDLVRSTALFGTGAAAEPDQSDLDEAWRRHRAAARAFEDAGSGEPRLSAMSAAAGLDLAALADGINIDRRVLNSLDAGRIILPVSERLVGAIAEALRATGDQVAAALTASFMDPRTVHAKADGTPATARVRYVDAVRGSGMSDERKAFWADED